MTLGGDDGRWLESVHTGPNGVVDTVANSGGNSFDPQATASLLRSTYATAGPNRLAYLDWEVTDEQFDRPYLASDPAHSDPDVHAQQHGFVHGSSLMSLMGFNAIQGVAGSAEFPPHCGASVGTPQQDRAPAAHEDRHSRGWAT